MAFVERLFPHEHSTMGQESVLPLKMKRLTLSLQDIPEGLVVSLPVCALGGGMITALVMALERVPRFT